METNVKLIQLGVNCIKGEIHSIMTLMRLNTRWAYPNMRNNPRDSLFFQEESHFVQSFRKLNEYLEGIYDLNDVDCVIYLTPFHQVIVSDQANGPLTSAALGSMSKFLLYGFLSANFPRAKEGIALIASCISQCIFEESDWESDEVILMKLLELSALSFRCDASTLMTVGAAWEIYSTCISIQGQPRASKILRSEAETALRHLTLTAFSRANFAIKTQNDAILEDLDNLFEENGDYNQLMKGKSWDSVSQSYLFDGTVGITLFLAKIMIVLSSHIDLQSQSTEGAKFALSLVNIIYNMI